VLADTSGTHDYFGRWGGTLDGLHMLNGFHTNAYCIAGGTGGRFATGPDIRLSGRTGMWSITGTV
jgi:hypothetical protein